ncbi:hypothetical protein KIH87_16090 [Paraneptunicella aestuarii]|uniref:hypothetical protein n=1 Tax=Paraneptunicella aestuarii TaxID=2831148 RepID=UPI001E40EEFD|nr:hypothetical protein [Paraneptunicella aestuarii]UAA38193.1 hypothetical protein KIH87_16090 [Paraneptunicella aestuarii]
MTNDISGISANNLSQLQSVQQLQQNNKSQSAEDSYKQTQSSSQDSTVSISIEAQNLLKAEQDDTVTLNSSGDRGTRPK